jgi:hypothetical protein
VWLDDNLVLDRTDSRTSVRMAFGAKAEGGFQGLEQSPIAVRQGTYYTLGMHLKGSPEVKVRVALVDPDGRTLWSQDVPAPGPAWQKTVLTFTPPRTVDDAALRIAMPPYSAGAVTIGR